MSLVRSSRDRFGNRPTRRQVMAGVAVLGGTVVTLGTRAVAEPLALDADMHMAFMLVGLIANRKAAARVGSNYLHQCPKEADLYRLVDLLVASMERVDEACPKIWTADAAGRALSKSRRQDFREGRVSTIEGWRLSTTEARHYGLTAIFEPETQARVSEAQNSVSKPRRF